MYRRLPSGSSAGVDQTPLPDGPHSCVPALFFVVGLGASASVNVFQSWRPLAGIERDHAAAERAAFVRRDDGRSFFERRHAGVETPVVERHGAGDHRIAVVVHFHLPPQRAGRRVERVDLRVGVPEEHAGAPARRRPDDGTRTNAGIGLECPDQAAGFRVEGVHEAVAAADERAIADDAHLRSGRGDARKPERPFHLQARHFGGGESGRRRGLKPRVAQIGAPPVPGPTGLQVDGSGGAGAVRAFRNHVERRPIRTGRPARQELGHGPPLGRAQRSALPAHGERAQRRLDVFGRDGPQGLAAGQPRHAALVAARTVLAIHGLAVWRRLLPQEEHRRRQYQTRRRNDVAHKAPQSAVRSRQSTVGSRRSAVRSSAGLQACRNSRESVRPGRPKSVESFV